MLRWIITEIYKIFKKNRGKSQKTRQIVETKLKGFANIYLAFMKSVVSRENKSFAAKLLIRISKLEVIILVANFELESLNRTRTTNKSPLKIMRSEI